MSNTWLEALSDGVIAILITIMVLELKVPNGGDMNALRLLFWLSLVPAATAWLGDRVDDQRRIRRLTYR